MIGEIWKSVPSAPGVMVSSEGRVMAVHYFVKMPKGGERECGGVPSFGLWDRKECRFTARIRGKTYKVHRLVAEAFHGSPPFENAVMRHVDENSANNGPSNLAWGTQKENMNEPGFIDYCRNRTGANSTKAKARKKAGACS